MFKLEKILLELKQISEKHSEKNKRNAEGFNIFSILFKSGDEVNLHSKFICELLNPKGNHYQGRLFLDLFLEELKLEISSENLLAFREKHNIDILLQSSKYSIIIENKIYTEDHSSQLNRYVQKVKSDGYKKRNISLVYLTVFGHIPTEKKMQNEVICLSYRKNIVHWLERCIEAVEGIPILRETLKQYLNLVKELTHQSIEKEFIMDVKNFLLKENNLQQVLELDSAVIEAKIEIQEEFWETLLSQLIPHYAFSFYNINNNKGLKSSVRRYYKQQRNSKNYGMKYQVDENLYFFVELRKNIYYGFEFIDETLIEQRQKDALNALDVQWRDVSETIYWKYPSKRLDFKGFNHQNIFDLIDEKQRKKDIKRISNEIIGLISQYEKRMVYV